MERRDIFLSYSRRDIVVVKRLIREFEAQGISVWWDFEIPSGQTYSNVIKDALSTCHFILVVWTENSATSNYVIEEADYAFQHDKLLCVRVGDDFELPFGFGRVQADDLSGALKGGARDYLDKIIGEIKTVKAGGLPQTVVTRDEDLKREISALIASAPRDGLIYEDGRDPENEWAKRPVAIELRRVNKHFGPVHANKDIDLKIAKGSIHGVVGENGAGKSTLMNILYGMHAADSGDILIDGAPVRIASSADAIRLGVGMVHQHFMLVRPFTVLENVMLGAEEGFSLAGSVSATRELIEQMGSDYGLQVDPDKRIEDLPVGLQQRVEIIKALRGGQSILILDEPTGVLTPQETEGLFNILRALRDQGATILLITHKLHEIMALTDRVSVMRQGEMVAHRDTALTSTEELAELMVGRKVLLEVNRPETLTGAPVLAARDIRYVDDAGIERLKGLTFDIWEGEVLAIAGVSGNGQSELLDVLSGILPLSGGRLEFDQVTVDADNPSGPAEMRRLGVAHVPEDRHHRGLVLQFDGYENSILGFQDGPEAGSGYGLDRRAIAARADRHVAEFDVRPPTAGLRASQYSGGNQQKLVLAREIDASPRLLLIGQPTRGVDIGAIEFIYERLMKLKAEGCAILLVSVELDEVMSLADRILVMSGGAQTGLVDRANADERTLGLMMAGVEDVA